MDIFVNILYNYHLLGRIGLNVKKIILLNKAKAFEELSKSNFKKVIMGNRMGLFPNYSRGEAELILTSGYNKVSVHLNYIKVDAGASLYIIYEKILRWNIYLPLQYPPNPYETIGGLFIQGLLYPIPSISMDELIEKLIYYDLEKREVRVLNGNFDRVIRRKNILLLQFFFRKYVVPRNERIKFIVGICKYNFNINKLIDRIPPYFNLSLFKIGDTIYLVSMLISKEAIYSLKKLFKSIGCNVKMIDPLRIEVYPNILPSLNHIHEKKICMYKDEKLSDDMIYYNRSSKISLTMKGIDEPCNCILKTIVRDGDFIGRW